MKWVRRSERSNRLFSMGIIGLLAVAIILSSSLFASASDVKLVLAYLPVKGTAYLDTTEMLPERIKKATNNRVEIILNDSLIKGTQLLQSVKSNRIQMTSPILAYYTATDPQFGFTVLPGLVDNFEELKALIDDGRSIEELNKVLSSKYNSKALMWGLYCPQNLISVKPIRTVADFKGKKIRVAAIEWGDIMVTLGAKPTPMPASEVVPALQRGIIDGLFTSACWSYGQKFYTMAKYMTFWKFAPIHIFPVVINNDSWSRMPGDLQSIMVKEFGNIQQEVFDGYDDKIGGIYEQWEAAGGHFYSVPESENKLVYQPEIIRPIYQSYFKRSEKVGFDAKKFVDNALKIMGKTLEY